MQSASKKRLLERRSSLPVLPALVVSIAMVALFVLGAPTDEATAKSGGGATFHGVTSQGYPGYVKTSGPGGLIVHKESIPLAAQCSFGPLILPQEFHFVPIMPSGRFKETAEGADVTEEGIEINIYESFSGKFNRQRTSVVTKSRIYVTAHAPDGSVEKCDSGVVTMHAHN